MAWAFILLPMLFAQTTGNTLMPILIYTEAHHETTLFFIARYLNGKKCCQRAFTRTR